MTDRSVEAVLSRRINKLAKRVEDLEKAQQDADTRLLPAIEVTSKSFNSVLELPMGENDAKAESVRDYLKALLKVVWEEEESFSGKRPFGNSGWQSEVYDVLESYGLYNGEDYRAADKLILEAIDSL